MMLLRILFLLGMAVTAGQILYILINGKGACISGSCEIVESYLDLGNMLLSVGGFCYFSLLFGLSILLNRKDFPWAGPAMLVFLLCGMVAEGILLGIQLFFAGTFCSYCLVICSIILLSSLLFSPAWFLRGLLFIAVEIFLMGHMAVDRIDDKVTLDQGTYGVRHCSSPNRVVYLLFSQSCPHCVQVLKTLEGCSACEIRFNPVQEISEDLLPGIEKIPGYDPGINRLFLRLADIHGIPVLIERRDTGLNIIRGEYAIMEFLKKNCFGSGDDSIDSLLPDRSFLGLDGDSSGTCSQDQGVCRE